tara:strand:- start:226 stop:561 length:336 start_codon:yes stop_codon:yes gene_type:complete
LEHAFPLFCLSLPFSSQRAEVWVWSGWGAADGILELGSCAVLGCGRASKINNQAIYTDSFAQESPGCRNSNGSKCFSLKKRQEAELKRAPTPSNFFSSTGVTQEYQNTQAQ